MEKQEISTQLEWLLGSIYRKVIKEENNDNGPANTGKYSEIPSFRLINICISRLDINMTSIKELATIIPRSLKQVRERDESQLPTGPGQKFNTQFRYDRFPKEKGDYHHGIRNLLLFIYGSAEPSIYVEGIASQTLIYYSSIPYVKGGFDPEGNIIINHLRYAELLSGILNDLTKFTSLPSTLENERFIVANIAEDVTNEIIHHIYLLGWIPLIIQYDLELVELYTMLVKKVMDTYLTSGAIDENILTDLLSDESEISKMFDEENSVRGEATRNFVLNVANSRDYKGIITLEPWGLS